MGQVLGALFLIHVLSLIQVLHPCFLIALSQTTTAFALDACTRVLRLSVSLGTLGTSVQDSRDTRVLRTNL